MSRKVCSAMLCNYLLVGLLVAPFIIARSHDSHVFFNFDRGWTLNDLPAVLPAPDIAHAIDQIVGRTKSTAQVGGVDTPKKVPASTANKSAPPDWMQRHNKELQGQRSDLILKHNKELQGLRSDLTLQHNKELQGQRSDLTLQHNKELQGQRSDLTLQHNKELQGQRSDLTLKQCSNHGASLSNASDAGVVQKESFHEKISVPSPIDRWRYLFFLAGILVFVAFIAWSGLSSKLWVPPHLSYVLSTLPTNGRETGGSFSEDGTFQSSLNLETLADAEYNREILASVRAKHDTLVTSQESSKAQILVLESKLAKSEGEKTSAASASLHAQSNTKIDELNAQIAKDKKASLAVVSELESKLAKSEGEKTSAALIGVQSKSKIAELNAQIAQDKKASAAVVSELERKLAKVEGEKTSALSLQVKSNSRIDELNAQIAKDKKTSLAVVSELESKLAKSEGEKTSANVQNNTKIGEFAQDMKASHAAQLELERKLAKVEGEKSSAALSSVQSKSKVDELNAQIAKDSTCSLAVISQLESSKAEILLLESKLAKVEGEKTSAASRLVETNTKIDEMNAQIAKDKKTSLAVVSELESKLAKSEGEKTSAASRLVETNTKIDEMNAQIAKDKKTSLAVVSELESKLAKSEGEKASANVQNNTKIDGLNAQIAQDRRASLDVLSDRDQMIISIASLESYTEKQTCKVATLESDIEKQNGKLESNMKLVMKLQEERDELLQRVSALEVNSKVQVGDADSNLKKVGALERKLSMLEIDTSDQISASHLLHSQISSERDDIFTSKQLGDKDIIDLKEQLKIERKSMKDAQAAWMLLDSENMEHKINAETDIIGLKEELETEKKNGMEAKKSATCDIAGLNKQLDTEKKNGQDLKQSTERDTIELNKQLKVEKKNVKDAKTLLDVEKKKSQDAKQLADRGNADLTTQLESEKTKKQGAIAARSAVDVKNKELLTVTSELKLQVDALSTTMTESDTHIAQLKKQMKTDKAHTDELNSQIMVERRQSLILTTENEELKGAVTVGEATAVVLRRQSAILYTENEELKGVVTEGEAKISVLRRQSFSRQQSNEEEIKYKIQIDQLTTDKTASDNRVSELEGQARVDKAHTKELVTELEGQLKDEIAASLSLQTQSIHLNASREPLEIALKASQDKADKSTAQIDDLTAQLKQKDLEVARLKRELDVVKAESDAREKANLFKLQGPLETKESGASQAELQSKIGDLEAHRDRLRVKAANARFGLKVDSNTSEPTRRSSIPQKFPENVPMNIPQNFSDIDDWVPASKAPITSASQNGGQNGAAKNGQSGPLSGGKTPASPLGAFDLFFSNGSGGLDDTNLVSDDENGEDSDSDNSGVRMGIFTDANHSVSVSGSDSESDSDRTLKSNTSRIDAMEEDAEIFPKRDTRVSSRRGMRPLLVTLDAVTLSDGEEERLNSGVSKSSTPTAPVSSLPSPHTPPSPNTPTSRTPPSPHTPTSQTSTSTWSSSPKEHHTGHLPGQGQTEHMRPRSRTPSLRAEEGQTLTNAYTVFTSMFKSASGPSSQRAPN